MKKPLFGFLAGLIVGWFALLISWQAGYLVALRERLEPGGVDLPAVPVQMSPLHVPEQDSGFEEDRRAALRQSLADEMTLDPGSVDPVVRAIEAGLFDRDWLQVEVGVEALRRVGATLAARTPAPSEEPLEVARTPTESFDERIAELGPEGLFHLARREMLRRDLRTARGSIPAVRDPLQPADARALVETIRSRGDLDARAAAFVIAASEDAQVRAPLLSLAGDPQAPLSARRVAAWALAVHTRREAVDAIGAMVEAPDPAVRRAGVEAVAGADPGLYCAVFVHLLADDPDAGVRTAAAEGLGGVDLWAQDGAARALIGAAGGDTDESVRVAALGAFVRSGERFGMHARPALQACEAALQGSPTPGLQRAVAALAAEVGGRDGLAILDRLSQLADEGVATLARGLAQRVREEMGGP